MSPRPRRLPDSAILEAAFKVVSRTGPERFTLADVGKEVGLSAATLVQRFGSKRELLRAMLSQTLNGVDARVESAAANHHSPLDALYEAAVGRSGDIDGPETLANRLAFLFIEMSDPQFRTLSDESARKAISLYKKMLDAAIDAGELTAENNKTDQLAEVVYAVTLGSLMLWAMMRDGDPKARIRRDLDALLRPQLTAAPSNSGSR